MCVKTVHRYLTIRSLVLMVFLWPCGLLAASSAPAETDVRLIIDVSGSMKLNDPKNLREPAVDLLVRLLPDGSRAGVWTFGKYVNMLVPYKSVDDAWRSTAKDKAKEINSVGLFTNIGEALERAAHDRKNTSDDGQAHIILLTDGMVDIDKDPSANQKEWQRIATTLLPELKKSGFTVHTIALSDNADKNLLEKMALATDGVAAVAHSAEDLMSVFLKAFDAAAPAEQVPFEGNSFVVDSSVEEFTALVFREKKEEQTKLISPDNTSYDAGSANGVLNSDLAWHRSESYDLITVKQPLEGEWRVQADLKPNSRITVISDLNLRVKPLPNNVFRGEAPALQFLLQEAGQAVKNRDLLALLESQAVLTLERNDMAPKRVWDHRFDSNALPADGIFKVDLPQVNTMGEHLLKLTVDGKTFQRHFEHTITVRQPFVASVRAKSDEANIGQFEISVVGHDSSLDVSKIQVLASITKPSRRKGIKPMRLNEKGIWVADFTADATGEYQIEVKVTGEDTTGQPFEYALDEVVVAFDPNKAFVSAPIETPAPNTEPVSEPEPEPKDNAVKSEIAEAEPVAEPVLSDTPEEASETSGLPSWLIYVLLGVGNLLLFGLGFFAFRKIMGGSQEDLEEISELAEEAPSVSEPKPEAVAEPAPAAPPEEVAEEAMETETEFAMDTAEDEEDEPPMEDLEAPSNVEEPQSAAFDLSEMEEQDDSTTAGDDLAFDEEMLSAEGLDLADEEMDESIANLLDELDGKKKQA